jgi:hypothetical protein
MASQLLLASHLKGFPAMYSNVPDGAAITEIDSNRLNDRSSTSKFENVGDGRPKLGNALSQLTLALIATNVPERLANAPLPTDVSWLAEMSMFWSFLRLKNASLLTAVKRLPFNRSV